MPSFCLFFFSKSFSLTAVKKKAKRRHKKNGQDFLGTIKTLIESNYIGLHYI
jgi:hypothetical protein